MLLQSIASDSLHAIEEGLPLIKKNNNEEQMNLDDDFDFDETFPLQSQDDIKKLEKQIKDKSKKKNLVNKDKHAICAIKHFRIALQTTSFWIYL